MDQCDFFKQLSYRNFYKKKIPFSSLKSARKTKEMSWKDWGNKHSRRAVSNTRPRGRRGPAPPFCGTTALNRGPEGAIAPAHRHCCTDSVAQSSRAGPARSCIPVPRYRLGFRSRIPSLRYALAPAQPLFGFGIFLQINLRHMYKRKI
jgi:hypothetical protein